MASDSHITRREPHGFRYRAEITSRGATPGMRSEIHDIAVRAGFADRAADVAIALTELVANAQQHGDPPFHVESWWDGRLVIEVSNHGTGIGDVVARRDNRDPQFRAYRAAAGCGWSATWWTSWTCAAVPSAPSSGSSFRPSRISAPEGAAG